MLGNEIIEGSLLLDRFKGLIFSTKGILSHVTYWKIMSCIDTSSNLFIIIKALQLGITYLHYCFATQLIKQFCGRDRRKSHHTRVKRKTRNSTKGNFKAPHILQRTAPFFRYVIQFPSFSKSCHFYSNKTQKCMHYFILYTILYTLLHTAFSAIFSACL